jgi:hypothetical protein
MGFSCPDSGTVSRREKKRNRDFNAAAAGHLRVFLLPHGISFHGPSKNGVYVFLNKYCIASK